MATDTKAAKESAKPAAEDDDLTGSEAPLLDHLIELRKRLIRALIVLFVLLIGCFFVAEQIFDILVQPYRSVVPVEQLDNFRLIYTAPQEFFFTQIKLDDLACSLLFGAGFQILQLFRLADIGTVADHFTVVIFFQPGDNDRCVQST